MVDEVVEEEQKLGDGYLFLGLLNCPFMLLIEKQTPIDVTSAVTKRGVFASKATSSSNVNVDSSNSSKSNILNYIDKQQFWSTNGF